MPTKKETNTQDALMASVATIHKAHGNGAIMRADTYAPSILTQTISTGAIALDLALGVGGIPRGRVTEIFGGEGAGKSTLAIHIMTEAQRCGGQAAYIDVEHALDPTYAENCGLQMDRLWISQPDSAEEALDIVEHLIKSAGVSAIVIDSVAALVPQAEIDGMVGDFQIGLQARLMSQTLRKLTSIINQSKTAVVFINQIREKIGVSYGSPEVTPGGRALKFYSSVRIDLRRKASIKAGNDIIGNTVRARIVKNKVAAPYRVCEFDIMFGAGISRAGSIIDVGAEKDIVKKAGAYYSYGETRLGQGKENSKRFLEEHPEMLTEIYNRIMDSTPVVPVNLDQIEVISDD